MPTKEGDVATQGMPGGGTGFGRGMPSGPGGVPTTPAAGFGLGSGSVTVASYDDYESAQRAVDYLSDNQFPVQRTAIVGTDLRLVEKVLGRVTVGRAAVAGAGSGAWFGLFIGLLFGIFSVSSWWKVVVAGVVIGAIWGAIFGALAHAATRGRRDFASRSALQAGQYAVLVDANYAEQARQMLTRLNWQTSGA